MASFWIFIILAVGSGVFIFVNMMYSLKLKGMKESILEASPINEEDEKLMK